MGRAPAGRLKPGPPKVSRARGGGLRKIPVDFRPRGGYDADVGRRLRVRAMADAKKALKVARKIGDCPYFYFYYAVVVFLFVGLSLAGFSVFSWLSAKKATAEKDLCESIQHSLLAGLVQYHMDHNTYPATLEMLYGVYIPDPKCFRCPGDDGNGNSSYIYIDWSAQPRGSDYMDWFTHPQGATRTPDQHPYPQVYDCRLSNHGSRGINIRLTDGTCIWDPKAKWLKEFAKTHPNAKIPLPEDIP